MAHIIILGAGIGGVPAAYELREALSKEHKITVVNATDYFQFVPSNPWLAVGWRTRDKVIVPIGRYLQKHDIGFIPKRVDEIDPAKNSLKFQDGESINYDYLLIATWPLKKSRGRDRRAALPNPCARSIMPRRPMKISNDSLRIPAR